METDDQSLVLLFAISELTDQKHSVKHIANVLKRAKEQVSDYRLSENQSDSDQGR
jgi:hypothetical protein